MAFVDTTASSSPAAFGAAAVDVVHYRYAKVLTDLLPPGRALTRREDTVLGKLLRALGMELSRVQRRSHRFLADCDPATSLAALEWWEILLGLPDCEVPTTIEERRIVAATKYAAAAGHDQSLAFWTELFATLGYDFTLFKFSDWLMTCEDECDDPLLDTQWLLLLWFIVEHGAKDGLLECRVAAEQLLGMKLQVHYHWDPIDTGSDEGQLLGLAVNSAGAMVAVGDDGLVMTSKWTLAEWTVQDADTVEKLYAVAAIDTVLVAVGEPQSCFRSKDNGVNWTEVEFASEEKYGIARGPEDDQVVVAVGDAGSIYRSDDAGLTWAEIDSPVAVALYAITACTGALVAVGTGGVIIRSDDAGLTWEEIDSPTVITLRAVDGRGDHVVAVGNDGVVVRSQDAGASWTLWTSGTAADLLAVTGNWDGEWFAGGAGGVILAAPSTTGDWALQATTNTNDLRAASESLPLPFACFVGDNRTIVVE